MRPTPPRDAGPSSVRVLAGLEARRMLRHPAPWCGLALAVVAAWDASQAEWSGASYTGLAASVGPLLLGISLAAVASSGRGLVPLAEDAPVAETQRSAARLLGGLALVGLVAVVVAAVATGLRLAGGVDLGDEPGRTLHAHHTLPELLQPVLLAAVAVCLGALAVRVLRHRLAASLVLALGWFLVWVYWLWQGPVVRYVALLQVQPVSVEVGPLQADPTTFPADWLLTGPGEHQDHWARVVVSPELAAWHDVYLLGLVAVLAALVVGGRSRRWWVAGGLVLASLGVAAQVVVAP
ncbi:hypothetical protein [Nocardioides abyssi]|uniref:ABC transporter permease n=1 Tax=Nocardioides abyssi TaxID=3058370 RepID=A0ABT8EYZ0_9ACTN|nr:hypothetical protein [Nocardioides abyssi]MDN4163411.1 hypothetical protein [Nocardioides abyssi]